MVNDNPIAFLKPFQPFPFFHNDTARLMACNHTGDIALRPFPYMLPVDAADIAAADRGRLCLNHYLPVTGLWNLKVLHLQLCCSPGRIAPLHHHFLPP